MKDLEIESKLRIIVVPYNKPSKTPPPRQLHPLQLHQAQWGQIIPVETPDNK